MITICRNKIATDKLNPTPSRTENYLWIPEVSDNVVPGLDSMITYTQSKYATITSVTKYDDKTETTQTEINNLRIQHQGGSGSSKELHYNTTPTYYMCQKSVLNNHTHFIIQRHFSHINEKINKN